jgi:hypothetical protein
MQRLDASSSGVRGPRGSRADGPLCPGLDERRLAGLCLIFLSAFTFLFLFQVSAFSLCPLIQLSAFSLCLLLSAFSLLFNPTFRPQIRLNPTLMRLKSGRKSELDPALIRPAPG